MTATVHPLASGAGWRVHDVVCTAGPHDRPFEEQHGSALCIAPVTQGTFQYRTRQGAAVLAPAAVLLGNPGDCFECGHEHGVGDRCLSFHFEPALLEAIVAAVPGVRRLTFAVPRLPPLAALLPLLAAAEAARDAGDRAALEEVALQLAAAVAATLADAPVAPRPSARDERRVSAALRRIEAAADAPLGLAEMADEAATSPYHFLRVFTALVGMTPHQYLLHTRLRRAAVRLRASDAPIAAIAYDAGFNDLSTFNRRFRRVTGRSPGAYRARF